MEQQQQKEQQWWEKASMMTSGGGDVKMKWGKKENVKKDKEKEDGGEKEK